MGTKYAEQLMFSCAGQKLFEGNNSSLPISQSVTSTSSEFANSLCSFMAGQHKVNLSVYNYMLLVSRDKISFY